MRALIPTLLLLAACGPREVQVGVDEAHRNRHRLHGYLWQTHGVFRQAGEDHTSYRFRSTVAPFHRSDRDALDIWVVAGVYDAIRPDEVEAMVAWVEDGGALWLMVDHPPFLAPAAGLASALGFELFERAAGDRHVANGSTLELGGELLEPHPVVDGPFGRVENLYAVWGTAFLVPDDAEVAAWAPDGLMPTDDPEARFAVLATREIGDGRVLLVGETSMFTCQEKPDGRSIGFCEDGHEDGRVAVRNAAAWLDAGWDGAR